MQLATITELARYWATDYDWRACEARLNALPQFKTEIDGAGIHFIHVRSRHENALPLIITHGWPGSIVELLEVIGPLTDPAAHGGSADDAFDLVLPSLPGFGFSAEPAETGWDPGRIARAWAELMRRLGYTGRHRPTHRHCRNEHGYGRPACSCRYCPRGGRRPSATGRAWRDRGSRPW